MLDIGRALRVVVHLNADVSSSREFLHDDILTFLYKRGVAGATVFRPEAGFGYHHRLHTKGAPGSDGGMRDSFRAQLTRGGKPVRNIM